MFFAGRGALRPAVVQFDRLAGDAIEDEEQTHLCDLRDSRDRSVLVTSINVGCAPDVPDVVMHQLLTRALSGGNVDGDERRAIGLSPAWDTDIVVPPAIDTGT